MSDATLWREQFLLVWFYYLYYKAVQIVLQIHVVNLCLDATIVQGDIAFTGEDFPILQIAKMRFQ